MGPFFSNVDNFRTEAYSYVISGVVVDLTSVKVRVKFGDSRSNHSPGRDCLTLFRTTTTTTTTTTQADGPYDNRAKRRKAAFCLKTIYMHMYDVNKLVHVISKHFIWNFPHVPKRKAPKLWATAKRNVLKT